MNNQVILYKQIAYDLKQKKKTQIVFRYYTNSLD